MGHPSQFNVCLAVVFLLEAVCPLAAQTPNDNDPNAQAPTHQAPNAQAPNDQAPEQPPLPERPVDGPEAIRQDQPSFLVRVNVDRETRTYRKVIM